MTSSRNDERKNESLEDIASQIRQWRQDALRDAEGVDDLTLANFVAGELDAEQQQSVEAKLAKSAELAEIAQTVRDVISDGSWQDDTPKIEFELRPPIRPAHPEVTSASRMRRILSYRTNFWLTCAASAAIVLLLFVPTFLPVQNERLALSEASKAQSAARDAARTLSERKLALRQWAGLEGTRNTDSYVASVAFSPDGRFLVAGSRDSLIRLWDVGRPDADFEWYYLNSESYEAIQENTFLSARNSPLSTFSIDVDTASYANVRRFLRQDELPPKNAVRIEELVNYFSYDYAAPDEDDPFSVNVEVAACPWEPKHQLAKIGLMGREFDRNDRPSVNLVFLLDVSGSMESANKLPLLKTSMSMLVENLEDRDRVAIVVYAGASGLVLPPTACSDKTTILRALGQVDAGGSTAGSEGIELAYEVAAEAFVQEGVNRVILCTDGDFNVGITDEDELTSLIEKKAKSGVFLSVLGFGVGNYKDSRLEKLADNGNGNYAYIDTGLEARKVLLEQLEGTLVTIAKDVKIQVDFNPAAVGAYRLIGYENRMLEVEDFRDNTKDAGEIGAGHSVTALYEIIPPKLIETSVAGPQSRYVVPTKLSEAATVDEMFTVSLRYKCPDEDESKEMSRAVATADHMDKGSADFRFAAAVSCFGMLLRDSRFKGDSTYEMVLDLAEPGRASDPNGYRDEFIGLVKTASALTEKDSR
jgi:Ca-activated chloride channel family protein